MRGADPNLALKSFPSGSAPGPSGLRANHLKQAVFCPSPDRSGTACPASPVLLTCSALVIYLAVSPPSLWSHPLALQEVWRPTTYCCWRGPAAKCTARAAKCEALDILAPLQLGVGISSGCEAIVHSVSNCLEDRNILPEDHFILLVDFLNAFNSVDHSSLFWEVRHHTPSISAWVECCYGSHPLLRLGDHTISSSCGVQQGDPLGPLGFALTLHQRIKREVPDLLINAWYLDDGILCGSLDSLASALAIIESESPSRDLFLNWSKSLIAASPDSSVSHPLLSDISVTYGGLGLL